MALSIEEMKFKLYKLYPLGDWQADVEAMPDHQVAALYIRMLDAGRIH